MSSRNSRRVLATLSLIAALATALLTTGGWSNSSNASASVKSGAAYPYVEATPLAGRDAPSTSQAPPAMKEDPRLKPACRFTQDSWTYVHLEGSPRQVGFQHGYLLQPEIDDAFRALKLQDTYRTKRDWDFYRRTAEKVLWPHVEQEYRDELNGIVEGLKARGGRLDLWDIVALNAWLELPYYNKWVGKSTPGSPTGSGARAAGSS